MALPNSAEVRRRQHHAPRRIEHAARRETPEQVAVRIEDVNETAARARHWIMLGGVLFGIGDPELTVDVLNSERRECTGDGVIDKLRVERGVGTKRAVPRRDLATPEIGGVQEKPPAVIAYREPLVHRTRG